MVRAVVVLVLLLSAGHSVHAQQVSQLVAVPGAPGAPQEVQGKKSPALAAILSWLVWPGVGSYYAGNSGHGTRHAIVGAAAAAGVIVLVATCDSDGFCDFDHDAVRLSAAIGFGAVWLGNSIWSIITAVDDAERRNASLSVGPVSIAPQFTVTSTSVAGRSTTQFGVRLIDVRF